jgi:hypothetical protein
MLQASFNNSAKECVMNVNVGGIDRALRIVAGLAILSLFFFLDGGNRWWALVGLIPLGTGLIGFCPAYLPFSIRTSKVG